MIPVNATRNGDCWMRRIAKRIQHRFGVSFTDQVDPGVTRGIARALRPNDASTDYHGLNVGTA